VAFIFAAVSVILEQVTSPVKIAQMKAELFSINTEKSMEKVMFIENS